MKLSSLILLVTFVVLIVALFVSNILLRKEYDKIDKSDNYWTYGRILEQPFRHLVIEGGNLTHIVFEPSRKSSVRVFKNWWGYINKTVKAAVKNDTLFLKFPNSYTNPNEKRYLGWITTVRLFSPELLSVDGHDTNFKLAKLQQKNLSVRLSGRSKLEVESYLHNFDSLNITQSDSSIVKFEISPDLEGISYNPVDSSYSNNGTARPVQVAGLQVPGNFSQPLRFHSWETIFIKSLHADLRGLSLLDVGHAQTASINLNVADSSGIILSGGTIRKLKK
jgi:hypothetical protein